MVPFAYFLTLAWAASGLGAAASQSVSGTDLALTAGSCENGPNSRQCWGDYSIDTDYYEETPYTGVTREYWFVIENITMAPDVRLLLFKYYNIFFTLPFTQRVILSANSRLV